MWKSVLITLGLLQAVIASGPDAPKVVEDSTEISALKCIVKNIDLFGTPSWKATVKFDEATGRMIEAPLSIACFAQCWWEIDQQTDATGLQTSEATLAGIKDHQSRADDFTKLAAQLKKCEEKKNAGTLGEIKVVDDFAPNTPAEFKTAEKKALCKLSLELDTCTNLFSNPVGTDQKEFNEIIPEHDTLADKAKADAAAAAAAPPPS